MQFEDFVKANTINANIRLNKKDGVYTNNRTRKLEGVWNLGISGGTLKDAIATISRDLELPAEASPLDPKTFKDYQWQRFYWYYLNGLKQTTGTLVEVNLEDYLMKLKIVGTQFKLKESQLLFKTAKIGDPMILRRDPMNPYDSNAIKVLMIQPDSDAFKDVGFIAKEQAAIVSEEWPNDVKYLKAILVDKKLLEIDGPIDVEGLKALQASMRLPIELTIEEETVEFKLS